MPYVCLEEESKNDVSSSLDQDNDLKHEQEALTIIKQYYTLLYSSEKNEVSNLSSSSVESIPSCSEPLKPTHISPIPSFTSFSEDYYPNSITDALWFLQEGMVK
jgi:hypothetical protein